MEQIYSIIEKAHIKIESAPVMYGCPYPNDTGYSNLCSTHCREKLCDKIKRYEPQSRITKFWDGNPFDNKNNITEEDISTLSKFLESGGDVNIKSQNSKKSLLFTYMSGKARHPNIYNGYLLKLCFKYNINPNVSYDGHMALVYAIICNMPTGYLHGETVPLFEKLLQIGANPFLALPGTRNTVDYISDYIKKDYFDRELERKPSNFFKHLVLHTKKEFYHSEQPLDIRYYEKEIEEYEAKKNPVVDYLKDKYLEERNETDKKIFCAVLQWYLTQSKNL
ncbi:MAG: hypothetical protein FWG80_00075 [Alphaproteobacteria bacterium]|nr:hypothetical protein [Alphaproteobacteria bacterium]